MLNANLRTSYFTLAAGLLLLNGRDLFAGSTDLPRAICAIGLLSGFAFLYAGATFRTLFPDKAWLAYGAIALLMTAIVWSNALEFAAGSIVGPLVWIALGLFVSVSVFIRTRREASAAAPRS